ncbi:MAG TPA: autotransporter outer membrane beta-barrel domain-containing protein [Devosia sp.]|jgi:fibronectin-binding autotransporter adhesin|uniref:autotransporter family protein n=1 Tax=Devosia sp. TaxID=1871048 RepID=UPI002DDD92B6|nr:autotransporter outer membrane beta-barrel domain-containing protein [Devosia sp.]HEV2517474.1 autotransporter outer membrane beta-barrel domain-containing protein [Devosia sp.]
MTNLSLNAGGADTARRAGRFFRKAPFLLSGVSLLALLSAALVTPAEAKEFTAANQTELYEAIAEAQDSPDAASTITLTGSFSLTSGPPAISGKAIAVSTGPNTLTLASGVAFDVDGGASLTLSGNVLGNGVPDQAILKKIGTGDLVINGVTASGISRIGLDGGHTLIHGGSTVSFGTSSGGSLSQLSLATDPDQVASLTISGQGTKLTATGTDSIALSSGTNSQSTLTIEKGAVLSSTSFVTVHRTASLGTAIVNVMGDDSRLEASGLFSGGGISYFNITDGGAIGISGNTILGGLAANVPTASADVTAVVSGAGSRWDTDGTLTMFFGSLSILDGGVVTATTANIATNTNSVATNFDVIVSGIGSELRANTIKVATRQTGTLTIANGGKVVVNGGNSAIDVGGAFGTSNAALNIGGAVGEAATGAGTLEASAVTLAASAEINFNHTETGYAFDIPINGSGAINQVAGHTIFGVDQLGFTGLTTISGGMLEVNGELGGTVNVTGGTLAGTGKVGDTSLAAGGTIAPGSNGIGELTINGDYTGGGLLQIETVLGDDTSATDRLVITDSSTGTTNVRVTNLGGGGGQTSDGIKIVDVGGTSDGIFSLLGDTVYEGQQAVIGGAYLYGLQQGTADGDWYLYSFLNPDNTPVFQPAAPVIETYAAAALQAFNTSESLQQRIGNRSWSSGSTEGDGIWGRIEARHTSLTPDSSTTGASYEVDTWRLQAGGDGVLNQSEAGTIVGGVNLQVGTISADISSAAGDGGIEGTAFGFGGTLTWYGNQGFYLDAQGKLNWFDSTLSANLLDRPLVSGNAGFGYALSLEAGQQLALGGGWSVTPQAQLAYSSVDFETFDSYGSTVALKSGDSLLGRLGISVDYETEWQDTASETGRTHLYGIANLTYEFLDGTATSVGADTLVNEVEPLWGSVGLGGSVNWAGDQLSLYGEANLGTSLNHLGDSYSLGVTAGLRGKL